ncbi:hypothetical protein [Acinetobacter guillouiae]|uniref:hypothetical protein n=1 Tax=Acinetobacter guillouiae TaxID=106649 RepID=UPI001CD4252B|nr:hypothetical protein [Acinetobacter guillouiae]
MKDNYIENAKKFLTNWVENLDVKLFVQQYESLNHVANSHSILLDDESLNTLICLWTQHANKMQNNYFTHDFKQDITTIERLINWTALRSSYSEIATLYFDTRFCSVDAPKENPFIYYYLDDLAKEFVLTVDSDDYNTLNNNELNAA